MLRASGGSFYNSESAYSRFAGVVINQPVFLFSLIKVYSCQNYHLDKDEMDTQVQRCSS